jgi:hypothetical protein
MTISGHYPRVIRTGVTDTPEAKIILGTSLNPEAIREGADVYFDCIINAHPPVYKVEWRHNVSHKLRPKGRQKKYSQNFNN